MLLIMAERRSTNFAETFQISDLIGKSVGFGFNGQGSDLAVLCQWQQIAFSRRPSKVSGPQLQKTPKALPDCDYLSKDRAVHERLKLHPQKPLHPADFSERLKRKDSLVKILQAKQICLTIGERLCLILMISLMSPGTVQILGIWT